MSMSNDPADDADDDDDPFSDEMLAFYDRPIWEVFGIERHFAPDEEAPPVNVELLRAYARDELSDEDRETTRRLIFGFRSWDEAWNSTRQIPGIFCPPWERHPSIFEHVRAHIREDRLGLIEGGEVLPDTLKFRDDRDFIEAGEMDWLSAGETDDGVATELLELVQDYSQDPEGGHKSAIYRFVLLHDTVGWYDQFLDLVAVEPRSNDVKLYELAKSFATECPDREPVKFGLAVMGRYGLPGDGEIFRILGRHDEFTRYCVPGVINGVEDPETALWELAQNVNGFGRIVVLEQLQQTQNPAIQDWLLREGYKISIDHLKSQLANLCSRAGRLRAALDSEIVDDRLWGAAGEIIAALTSGYLDDYPDGMAVVERYLSLLDCKPATMLEFSTVARLRDYLDDQDGRWNDRSKRIWSPDVRRRLFQQCSAIVGRPACRELVLDGLQSDDEELFNAANRIAGAAGIDTWMLHRERLLASPRDPGRWRNLTEHVDCERIDDVVELVEKLLPSELIFKEANVSAESVATFVVHHCLDCVLIALRHFPGHGCGIVRTGLRSPVSFNRVSALRILTYWRPERWPEGTEQLLQDLRDGDPDEEIKTVVDVLFGEGRGGSRK